MADRKHINLLLDFAPLSEFQRQIAIGATRYCHEHPGFRCRTASTEAIMMEDSEVIDGVIAIVDRPDPKHPSTRHSTPVVNVSTIAFPVPFPTVAIDNSALGRLAAEHLIVQGYRFFAYHMESRVYFSKERGLGFGEAIREAGSEFHIFDTGLHTSAAPRELHALTVNWLRQLPKPLGLFTHNDQRAAALMDLCRDAGLKVPEEVGIVGVDNDPLLAQLCRPSLTSVDPGASTVGFRAAEMLAQLLSGQVLDDRPILLPPKAVSVRESTQPLHLLADRLASVLRYIQEHWAEPFGVSDLLEAVPASRRSLERLFQTHLGRSPAEEIRRVQINHVKWLLMEGRASLSEIATRAGFSSFSNFATAFRREVGMTASAYRKRFRPAIKREKAGKTRE
jgi:LacI family transcriptional regulator